MKQWLVGTLGLFRFLWHGKPAVCMLMTNVLIIPPDGGTMILIAAVEVHGSLTSYFGKCYRWITETRQKSSAIILFVCQKHDFWRGNLLLSFVFIELVVQYY